MSKHGLHEELELRCLVPESDGRRAGLTSEARKKPGRSRWLLARVGRTSAAKRIGLTLEEYEAKEKAGLKYCCGCKDWHPATTEYWPPSVLRKGASTACKVWRAKWRNAKRERERCEAEEKLRHKREIVTTNQPEPEPEPKPQPRRLPKWVNQHGF